MAQIAFQGPEDLRILAAADLKKADIDGFTKTTFTRGEATDVEPAIAAAILGAPNLFGKFEEISSDAELPEAPSEPLTDTGAKSVTAERSSKK